MTLQTIAVTIDGYPTPMEGVQWGAGFGGYDLCTGRIKADDAKRLPTSVQQGSELTVYTADGTVRYQGRLATDPTPNDDGTYGIKATGHNARAYKANTPLRYQTRDYALWADGQGDPHNYTEFDSITGDLTAGGIRFRVDKDTSLTANDLYRFTLWTEGTTIRRVACTWAASAVSSNFSLRAVQSTGPSGAGTTLVTETISATSGTLNTGDIASPTDQMSLMLYRGTTGTITAPFRVRVADLRVWGDRTVAATFNGVEVLQDIASQAGYDSSGVAGLTTNVLPLWADEGESWADVMSYVTMINNGWWRVLDDRGSGPYLEADTWANSKTWTVNAAGSHRNLAPMEKFNRVRVTYPARSGKTRKYVANATVAALDDRGLVNAYPLELADVQPDATLATTLGDETVEYLSGDRYEGTITIVAARDEAGRDDPYGILPGDKIIVSDWDQGTSKTLRVTQTQASEFGVTVSVGGDFPPVERIEALHGLQSARRRMAAKVRKSRNFADFTGAAAQNYLNMLATDKGPRTRTPKGPQAPSRREINRLRRQQGLDALTGEQYRRRFTDADMPWLTPRQERQVEKVQAADSGPNRPVKTPKPPTFQEVNEARRLTGLDPLTPEQYRRRFTDADYPQLTADQERFVERVFDSGRKNPPTRDEVNRARRLLGKEPLTVEQYRNQYGD